MAAAYVDARSVAMFLEGIGTKYPHPISGTGVRGTWRRSDLDLHSDDLSKRHTDLCDLV